MANFCPQCGNRVSAGVQVCPQCGASLKLVFQDNSNGNISAGSSFFGIKKRDNMLSNGAYVEHPDPLAHHGMTIKYNTENTDLGEIKLADDDMSITGISDETLPLTELQSEEEEKKELEQQNKIPGAPSMADALAGMMESSKYRIITQVYDKKTGFNAVELESKLNMYAKMGYHIVPNTMICQPGQDFFALMEKTSDTAPAQKESGSKE